MIEGRESDATASRTVAVCAAALTLYGIVPFNAAEQTSTAIWLNAMHLAAAAPMISLLARFFAAEDNQPATTTTEPQRTTA